MSKARGCHREACVDLGVDVLPLGFEVEGCGGGVLASAAGEGHGAHTGLGGAVGLGVLGADVGEFDEGGEGGAEGLGVFAGALDGFADGLLAGLAVDGRVGAQGPPGAVDAGEVEVGEAGGEFAEGGEVDEFGGDVDPAVVAVDALASAVFGEFGGDGEAAGLQAFDCLAVAFDQVEDGGVAAGEVVEGGAAVGAAGGDGDADPGDLGVDLEAGLAADGDARGVGSAVGDGGWGSSGVGVVIRPTLSGVPPGGHQIETWGTCRVR